MDVSCDAAQGVVSGLGRLGDRTRICGVYRSDYFRQKPDVDSKTGPCGPLRSRTGYTTCILGCYRLAAPGSQGRGGCTVLACSETFSPCSETFGYGGGNAFALTLDGTIPTEQEGEHLSPSSEVAL